MCGLNNKEVTEVVMQNDVKLETRHLKGTNIKDTTEKTINIYQD